MILLILGLLAVAVAIIVAATRLAAYADAIAERFSVSRSWIGLVFVSIVTTLPEGTVTLSALIQVGRPDLALSNNFGSIAFNLTVIALVDLFFLHGGILRKTRESNALPVACAMTLMTLVLIALLFPLPLKLGPLHAGAGTLVAIMVFWVLFRLMQKFEAREIVPQEPRIPPSATLSHPVRGFVLSAAVVIVGAMALAHLGDRLADTLALRHSFVGFILLAGITSLPELTFGIAAVRLGAYDLLIGNVMGANMINLLMIAGADLVIWREPLGVPGTVGMDQILTGLLALFAMALILLGILHRQHSKRRRWIGLTSGMLLILYILSALAVYFGTGVSI